MTESFSLHTRETKKGPVFYVQFRNSDGSYTNAKSTKIIDRGRKKDRDAAVKWAQNYLNTGQVLSKENVTLDSYSAGFFDWTGPWAQDKVLRGKRISEQHCDKHAENVKTNILPYFKGKKISIIDEEMIRKWQLYLSTEKGLKGGTINRQTSTLSILLKQAFRDKIIRTLPVIERVAEKPPEKGIFTPDEIRKIFSEPWGDFRFFTGNLLAAVTGLRASEISALREAAVHTEYLDIVEAFSPKYGLHPTKTGKPRIVPIPDKVAAALAELIKKNPHSGNNRFVFYSYRPDRPVDPDGFNENLKKRLEQVGISEKKRTARNLSFHSWRHGLNTLLINQRVPLQSIQAVTGHLSDRMTEHYYHVQGGDLSGIRQIQDTIT